MSFKDHFCSSPWFHTRINNSGDFESCRSATRHDLKISGHNIREVTPVQWFQQEMAPMRRQLLAGEAWSECSRCHEMEQHGKVSIRQKQLLKTGIDLDLFEKTLLSSPWIREFEASQGDGTTDLMPQDWQIDLGNYCNSACIMCDPRWSSSLAAEFAQLGMLKQEPKSNWARDESTVASFMESISKAPLRYLHFLGGETILIPAFRQMLAIMIDNNRHRDVTVGFTTNTTTWRQDVIDLLCEFGNVHVGTSVECLHALNDYVRYPSQIDHVRATLDQWVAVSRRQGWTLSLRITPTLFSVWHLDTIFDYAWQQGLPVESCDFLTHPEHLRMSLLPLDLRQMAAAKLQLWLAAHPTTDSVTVVNTRHPDFYQAQLVQDARSYVNYLLTAADEGHRVPYLIDFLHRLERNRHNSILDYLPEYEQFLRSAGY